MTPPRMPVLFIGHGSPMNAVSDNDYTRALAEWGKRLPRPRAIMVVSAHWLTGGRTLVLCHDHPRTIHDFYGFPQELYRIVYPAPGAPAEAEAVTRLARKTPVACDTNWGLDHASWAVLRHLYPDADIPTFELSLDYSFNDWHPKPLRYHYNLARELAGLRDRGVLIIGSGNIVHNLSLIDFSRVDAPPCPWATAFDEAVTRALRERDHDLLLNLSGLDAAAELSVPTLDHYLPMIYAAALQEENEPLAFVHEGFQHASVSMRSFQIG